MIDTRDIYDITIIGGGPTGMFAAFYAGLRQVKTKIIETLPVLGGQVEILYPEKKIYDVGGFAGVKGEEFIDGLEDQINHFDPELALEEKVLNIDKIEDNLFKITTTKNTHYSKTVIIATGQGSFKPRRLPVDNSKEFEDNNLHYVITDIEKYRDTDVLLVGGGDTAVDWANTLEPIAKSVTVAHRRNKFRAHEASVKAMENSSIDVYTPYVISELKGKDGKLESVILSKPRSDEFFELKTDYLIVNYGFVSSNEEINEWGIEVERGKIKVNQKMETSIPGIYACGDIVTFDGKIDLIATGFGEGPTAVNHAVHKIFPDQHTQPIQSTKLDLE